MFSRRSGDTNPRRFWSWFAAEAQGLSNGLEALARGESDGNWLFEALSANIHRYDAGMTADLVRSPDGTCELHLSGGSELNLATLLTAAPKLAGWRVMALVLPTSERRVPARIAPRPSLDLLSPIQARHEAYAH
jgi:hypothetical protein